MIEQSDMLIEQVKAKHTVIVQDSSVDTSIRKNYIVNRDHIDKK